MLRTARVLLLLAVVLLISGTALAQSSWLSKTADANNRSYEWQSSDWYKNENNFLQLDVNIGWMLMAGCQNCFELTGFVPEDPIVNQKITNYTYENWTDWHVQLINGQLVGMPWVIKEGDVTYWDITIGADPGYDDGFTAIGWPPAESVGNMEALRVYFVYEPINPDLRVTIKQWPTTDYIPEPGSLMALSMGMATLAITLRRRLR